MNKAFRFKKNELTCDILCSNRYNIILTLIVLSISFSCDDILEEDITNDTILITSPLEDATIASNTVQFTWEDIDGADDYRIQIITANQVTELDSLVATTTFTYPLSSGSYQWRVRGENFAYQTSYIFPILFSIEASTDLSTLSVLLKTPSENFYTNNKDIVFTWDSIDIADTYTFDLIKKLNGEQTIFQEENISTTSLSLDATTLDEDAEYEWRVKAIDTTTETVFSERTFYIDTVIPNQPTLTEPTDQVTVDVSIVTFNWTNGVDTGNVKSAITNSLEIATDLNFNTIIHTENTSNNTLQYDFTTLSTYYWRVKAFDEAANESDYSTVRTIVVE